ncbi:SusC/RagA family TonB-linked outer membrane protein [Galbibacter sp. EGI 63066]|uniref:SusC/RagA family TonB-linked outer membrane protein n=1 Tax=Galbibacter sp. EGI 63066 TaxID=2993559 RepID=UPI002248D0DF|nr:SusC/RagA family TonB-linked outer membrane protein [Galbibacter sp. EGI 63066]MCX2679153.1 SusC/RagA family TonB-linked outer membrane protein [Galbibacter sp. EGI 63066]
MKKNAYKWHKLIMRISSLYIVIVLGLHGLFATEMNGQALRKSNIVLNKSNYKLEELFRFIEENTAYNFVVSEEQLDLSASVETLSGEVNLLHLLEAISKDEQLRFYRVNELISVSKIKKFPIREKIQVIEQMTVTGVVTDQDGVPLPGATVQVNDATSGVVTDFSGNFTINASKGDVLRVTYVGFSEGTVTVGDEDFYQIELQQDVSQLDEVVVTALGIKREEKKLGFVQQTVSSEQLTDARPNNWSEALRGKVPGLTINGLGGPISSQQVILRGNNSLDPGNNGALIVIDGIPIQNEFPGSGASNGYMGGAASNDTPVDYGNAISDLNPDDIEDISVLKGPAASALYGYQAANGAVVITTKSGKKQKGLGVTISSNTKFDVITRTPDWQYEYGQGSGKGSYVKPETDENGNPVPYNDRLYYTYGASEDGRSTGGSSSAFGPKFDGQYYYQYDPEVEGQSLERQLWRPYKNNRSDFWRTGVTQTQNISIQGGGDKGSMRGSITRTKNDWIMPNTGFEQTSLSVNANYQVSERVRLTSVVNYRKKTSDNLPGQGYNNHSIAYFMIFQNPSVDLAWYEPIWKKGQEQVDMIRPYSSYIDNPYAMVYEIQNSLDQNSVTGNFKMDIDLFPHVSLMLRGALNTYNKNMDQERPYDINRYPRGYYRKTNVFKQEINTDFLLNYANDFENFELNVNFGGNSLDYKYLRQDSWAEGLEIPGEYNLVNGSQLFTSKFDGFNKVNSLYGMVSLGWQDKVFLDITGRNDWNSMLPEGNQSYFFPSASTAIILSEMFSMSEVVSFVKLRASVAQVGGAGQFGNRYKTNKYYGRSDYPGSAIAPTSLYNTNLKPEITTNTELGLDFRMFDNRLKLDATVYQATTKNQIMTAPLPRSSGYSSVAINAGEVQNRGVELMLDLTPVKTPNFKWNTTLTWAKNEGKVLSLHENAEEGRFQLLSSSGARLVAEEGGSPAALYGRGFQRSPDGEVLYNEDGFPLMTDDIIYVGDTQPKWVAGFINSFQYKNFRLSAVIDGKYGGMIYSHTHHKTTQQGKLKHTLVGRDEGELVGQGVVDNGDGTYSPNTTPIPIAEYYNVHWPLANTEANSFDASFIKLREVTLEYNFTKRFLKNTGLNNLTLSLYGRNLAVISDFPIYDPEVAGLAGGTNMHPGVEVGQMPVPTEFGMNIKIGF